MTYNIYNKGDIYPGCWAWAVGWGLPLGYGLVHQHGVMVHFDR